MEYEDLENIDSQSLKLIFNNIIDTLFSKESVESRKCQIKKKGIFTNWISSNISYDKLNFLLNFSNKSYTFEKF